LLEPHIHSDNNDPLAKNGQFLTNGTTKAAIINKIYLKISISYENRSALDFGQGICLNLSKGP